MPFRRRIDRTHTPPPDQLAQLKAAWESLSPQLPEYYCPVIDDRLALVDSYASTALDRTATRLYWAGRPEGVE